MSFVSSSEKSLIELSSEEGSSPFSVCSLRASSVAYFFTYSDGFKKGKKHNISIVSMFGWRMWREEDKRREEKSNENDCIDYNKLIKKSN